MRLKTLFFILFFSLTPVYILTPTLYTEDDSEYIDEESEEYEDEESGEEIEEENFNDLESEDFGDG